LAILSAIDNPASAAGLLESSASKETLDISFFISTGSSFGSSSTTFSFLAFLFLDFFSLAPAAF